MSDDSQGEAMEEEDALPHAKFMFMGMGEGCRPKWMSFPCQSADARANPSPGRRCMIPIRPKKNDVGASWDWNGDREKPTMSPSVNCKNCWHGWIRDGEFTDA